MHVWDASLLVLTLTLVCLPFFPAPASHSPSCALYILSVICLPLPAPTQQQDTSDTPSSQPPTGYASWTAGGAGPPTHVLWQALFDDS